MGAQYIYIIFRFFTNEKSPSSDLSSALFDTWFHSIVFDFMCMYLLCARAQGKRQSEMRKKKEKTNWKIKEVEKIETSMTKQKMDKHQKYKSTSEIRE